MFGIHLESETDIIVQVGVMATETFLSALAAACNLLGWDEQRVNETGHALTPRLEALYRAVTGKSEPGTDDQTH